MSSIGQFKESLTPSLVRRGIWLAFLFCLCGYSQVVSAATDISQPITADTTWSQAGSPYVVLSPITVSTGVTLTIQEGVVVKFEDTQGLTVLGSLQVQGQTDLPVTFTSVHDDSVAGDTNQNGTSTQPGGIYYRWSGVTFSAGSTGDIFHSKFGFAGYQRTGVPPKPAVYNQGGTVTVRNSTFENNWQFGAGQTTGSITIIDTVFDLQNIGVAVKGGDVTITRTTFKNASHFGLMVGGAGALTISENNFINNYYPAGFWLDAARQIQMNGNQTSGGYENGILLRGPVVGNVTLPKTGGISYLVSGVGGTPDGSGTLSFPNANGLEVSAGSSLTLTSGVILKSKNEVGIEVKGGLNLLGTPTDPVIYTAINDDTVGGSVKVVSIQPNFGSGGYLRFHPGSTGEINNTTIKYGSNAFRATASTLINNGGVVNVADSIVTENKYYAIYQLAGTTTIHTSLISNAGRQGIFNALAAPLDATNNYWGDPSGPKHPTINPAGLGASISDNVSVTPWLGVYPPEPPAPLGASSILFLPGIQASRLYKEGLFGLGEDQVWPPNALFNEDIRDLSMSSTGVSEEAIYTRDIIDSSAGIGSVYGGFTAFMNQLKSEGVIDDWEPFAYDWRYSVTDIAQSGTQYESEIRNAVNEIERLSDTSLSGQVTMIGHSNGGLLAKAIARQLEAEGKSNLIDKIILLASPQIGTPKAIGTTLHGYDQTDSYGGFILDGQIVREVINNMPGAYGLLPSEKYFEGLDTPLISFNDTSVTAGYRQTYGPSISSYQDYLRFLRGEDGFDRDLGNAISVPARANGGMLDGAQGMHNSLLDNWIAPAEIEVIEVVGTGLPTMRSVEYREVLEDKCLSAGPLQVCTPVAEIKPYAVLTKYGDRTVVQRSAEGYEGEKRKYFVNLPQVSNGIQHYNIGEAFPVQNLLKEIILSTTTSSNQIISTSHTEFSDQYEVEMIDSPVRMLVTDTDGNQTGIVIVDGVRTIKQEIPGSQYFEFGDTKYFVVPKGTNRTTRLYGEGYGGYTLTTATLDDSDTQTIRTILPNASTSPTMLAEYSNENSVFSTVVTDSDGDGTVDLEATLEGEVIEKEVEVTYPLLISTVESTNLSRVRKQSLLLIIKSAEYYGNKLPVKSLYLKLEDALLKSAQDLVKLYLNKRYLTATEADLILEMLQTLKDKQ